ncbi:hypothetical protein LCGC14_1842390 [marine sediment metagenome]|uniref:Uncharacterized protein n=1 Tax=marine sediment metagenome TaxID=412755 RepID=A0A0F9H105_9ZZZZ
MGFIFEWFLIGIVVLIVMSINNLLWINKGGEWYSKAVVSNRFWTWKGPIRNYSFPGKIKYFFGYRVLTVWTNWRDILSAIIGGFMIIKIMPFILAIW